MDRKWTPALIFWQVILTILIAISFVTIIVVSQRQSSYNRRYAEELAQTEYLQDRIDKEQKAINSEAYDRAMRNAPSQVKMNIKQINASEEAKDKADELFNILLTYSTSKEFNSRADKAKDLVSANVLANKDLFGSDYDDGSHYVDDSGLHSVYLSSNVSAGLIKDNKLPLVIRAVSTSWFTDQNHAQTADIYIATYDYTQKRFTELRLLNNLFRGNSSTKLN